MSLLYSCSGKFAQSLFSVGEAVVSTSEKRAGPWGEEMAGDTVVIIDGSDRTPFNSCFLYFTDLCVAYEYGWIHGFSVVVFTSGSTTYGLRMVNKTEVG